MFAHWEVIPSNSSLSSSRLSHQLYRNIIVWRLLQLELLGCAEEQAWEQDEIQAI